ncbi:MAG: hypothetical protein CMJ83_03025 [Planctomycetes bacterium]|nr:hypothetical protein [Planctomycetota bacterium]
MRYHRLEPLILVLGTLGFPGTALSQSVSFQRDVLPILSDRCFMCHGPDEKARLSKLRLDREESALRTVNPVIVRGRSGDSELIARITARDARRLMPPADSHLTLTAAEVRTLERWIDAGAPWDRHWAFEAPARPVPPAVAAGAWPRNDLDRFVRARLERDGRRPSPPADKASLLRRVTLDLTGLPPTLGELDAFLGDSTEDAYERAVDRLLDSPRYGERMAWEWLDAARYADTDGFQADPTRTMWPWREWLIRALNHNLPFDQFTVEMLAGDLLPNATQEQIVASGFNRNHMYNGEGGRIPEETRVENVFDRTETTATVWLGLTVTCARCHDHKYDPITQKEYYGLYAFFNQTSESGAGGQGKARPRLRYHPQAQRKRLIRIKREVDQVTRRMRAPDDRTDRAQREWEQETAARLRSSGADLSLVTLEPWHQLGPLGAPGGVAGKTFATDYGPERGVNLARTFEDGRIAWKPAPKLEDGETHALPQRVGATYLYRVLTATSARSVDISLGSDDGIRVWLNGKQVLSKNANRGVAPDQERVQLQLVKGRNELLLKIVNTGGAAGVYFRKADESVGGVPGPIARALLEAPENRNPGQTELLLAYHRERHSPPWRAAKRQLAKLEAERSKLEKGVAQVMVMDSLPEKRRRTTQVLQRGSYDQKREVVTESTPGFLPPLPPGKRPDRLTLARWLVDDANPLTARVTVNRYWQMFFGRGLVETIEDFGQQGSPPSHPELLDWLATTFVRSGWDVKALHKLIVMSATYRQSSRAPRAAYMADPNNVLLARGPRFRLPSWMLRDQALALGKLLVERIGGPSVKPYQPAGVWAEATFGKIRYRADTGDAVHRRSLYVFWRRIVGPTMFFDTGKRQACVVRQVRTNSPLHALTTLNETAFVEAARFLAMRTMREGGNDARTRIAWTFRLATSRQPSDAELDLLVSRWRSTRDRYKANPQDAARLLAVGDASRDTTLDAVEHAAYTVICSILLNLDEVLSKP